MAAQAVTARVFLTAPSSSVLCCTVLHRTFSVPCVVLLKKAGPPCAILSYISTCAFRVTLGKRAV